MHQSRGFDPETGVALASSRPHAGPAVFADELVRARRAARRRRRDHRRDVRADRARRVRRRFPDRTLRRRHRRAARGDLGGRARLRRPAPGRRRLRDLPQPGLRPAADGRRAAPAAGHRRARPRRASPATTARRHNGMWDLAILGVVPGLRIAAPRDEATLRAQLREAVAHRRRADRACGSRRRRSAPTCPAVRRVGGVDVLAEHGDGRRSTCCSSRSARRPADVLGRGRRGRAAPGTRCGSSTRAG